MTKRPPIEEILVRPPRTPPRTPPDAPWCSRGRSAGESLQWVVACGAILGLSLVSGAAAEIPAFPGAQGFGASTPGGRGGQVLHVTNLNDDGPGSLRAACEAEGPRVVVFRVGGLISLERGLTIENPYMTLAGQSAPADGICLSGAPFKVATHDVVIRYLRSRLGDESGRIDDSMGLGHGARNVVFDHCSASWSVDEVFSLSGDVSDVTVQWCLIAEALNRSIHTKGAHGMGTLARANGPVSFHHNLWVHNDSRNPRLGDNYNKPPFPRFDFRHNVIYNYGKICTGTTQGRFPVNYVGNYIRPGPNSADKPPISVGTPSDLRFFISGNVLEGDESLTEDNRRFFSSTQRDGRRLVTLVDEPFPAPVVDPPGSAAELLESVLALVGANRPARDAVDERIVEEVRTRTGRIIDSQSEVGGWPVYRSADPPRDTDMDGMPDAWEIAHGLDPLDPSDHAGDRDGDGYTHIEDYLNGLAAGN